MKKKIHLAITSGIYKGRYLSYPKKTQIRPTQSRVKQAIFNILQQEEFSSFIDLFAGTGNVGLEALSRSYKDVLFIESNFHCIQAIQKNLKILSVPKENYRILHKKAQLFLKEEAYSNSCIYLDPPYHMDLSEIFVEILKKKNLWKDNLWVLEQDKKTKIKKIQDFYLLKKRIYGNTQVLFLKIKT